RGLPGAARPVAERTARWLRVNPVQGVGADARDARGDVRSRPRTLGRGFRAIESRSGDRVGAAPARHPARARANGLSRTPPGTGVGWRPSKKGTWLQISATPSDR